MVKKIRCICEICTCGRHHCIHRPKETRPNQLRCLATEYKDTYKQYPLSPTKAIKPDTTTRFSEEPFDGSTMYKMTFVPLKHDRVLKKQKAEYVKPSGTIDYISSYQRDFEEKYGGKTRSAKPEYKPITSKRPFSGTTVNQETYRKWEVPRVASLQAPKGSLKTSMSRFDHKSTFQHDFPGFFGNNTRQMIKPLSSSLTIGNGEFIKETTTRCDYTPKSVAKEKSARPPAAIISHTDGFDHQTTAQHSYAWPDGIDPAISCKPTQQTIQSKEAIQKDTTHRSAYKEWNIAPTQAWKPNQEWKPSEDRFEHKTTFQHDFIAKQAAPARSLRPEYKRDGPQGAFEDSTTNKLAYRPWSAAPREIVKPENMYQRPKTRFEGQTTFRTDFQGQQTRRPDLCVPQENNMHMGGERVFSTSYKSTYQGERPPSCPARYLHGHQSDTDDFTFSYDRRGHQFFRKQKDGMIEITPLKG